MLVIATPVPLAGASAQTRAFEVAADTDDSRSPDTTANEFLDLERSLTECISSNPPPGCGRKPTGPGDRGGWQQLVLFGVMTSGISVIFWRVARSVRRRDADQPERSI